jgi:hypothetical protein
MLTTNLCCTHVIGNTFAPHTFQSFMRSRTSALSGPMYTHFFSGYTCVDAVLLCAHDLTCSRNRRSIAISAHTV